MATDAPRPTSQRPNSPHLTVYRWSWPMAASIAHRASGVLLVGFVPFYLWLLHAMVGSQAGYDYSYLVLHSAFGRLLLWLVGSALIYHFCNGIRFLLLDAGVGEQRETMIAVARWPIYATGAGALLLAIALL
ncbi:MAG: succinate dehydrogenase, cytochrome b556 subunit [Mariprofundales bacterium]|nr:succinate dehydrogenase, cytochrome b556 subunit [Mariprofundales bacterium]